MNILKTIALIILAAALFLSLRQSVYSHQSGNELEKSVSSVTVHPGDVVTVSLKIPGQIERVAQRQKADTMLVMDVSGSMGWEFGCDPANPTNCDSSLKIDAAQAALKAFVDQSEENFDYVGLVSYSNKEGSLDAMLQNMNSGGKQNIKTAIDKLFADGSTSIGNGLYKAVQELLNLTEPKSASRPGVSKYVVLASDGKQNACFNVHGPDPNCSIAPPNNWPLNALWPPAGYSSCACPSDSPLILQTALTNKIKIFTVGIGWDVKNDKDYHCDVCKSVSGDLNGNGLLDGEDHLMYIAQASGGQYFHIKNSSALAEIYKRIQSWISLDSSINLVEGINTRIAESIADRNRDGAVNSDDLRLSSCGSLPLDLGPENVSFQQFDKKYFIINAREIYTDQTICVDFDVLIDAEAESGRYSIDSTAPVEVAGCAEKVPLDAVVFRHEGECEWKEFPLTEVKVVSGAPSISDFEVAPVAYCETANQRFGWVYSGAGNESQFQLQVSRDKYFTDLAVNRCGDGKAVVGETCPAPGELDNPSGTANNQMVFVAVAPAKGQLAYNTKYWWRVKVWDINGISSEWTSGPSFVTPKHLYPAINFSWAPLKPGVGEDISFTDRSTAYGGATKASWNWIFSGGDPSSSNQQNPVARFVLLGAKRVTLSVTDSDNLTCTLTKTLNIRLPIPQWKEITPF
ncbi:VWA domain-containing protein [Candidatus Falkowbacteria bacterium]|nr:VWA domain-containing protein [Candidatus Falkowbacteria bacterium]